MKDPINYTDLADEVMREVVAKVLRIVETEGLIYDHYFYISFSTTMQGVQLSDRLKERYPKEITIVLQHQFENLFVENDRFSVNLRFDGVKETVIVPFKALTSFADPSVKFALQFKLEEDLNHKVLSAPQLEKEKVESRNTNASEATEENSENSDSNVIAFDRFLRKKNTTPPQ